MAPTIAAASMSRVLVMVELKLKMEVSMKRQLMMLLWNFDELEPAEQSDSDLFR